MTVRDYKGNRVKIGNNKRFTIIEEVEHAPVFWLIFLTIVFFPLAILLFIGYDPLYYRIEIGDNVYDINEAALEELKSKLT